MQERIQKFVYKLVLEGLMGAKNAEKLLRTNGGSSEIILNIPLEEEPSESEKRSITDRKKTVQVGE